MLLICECLLAVTIVMTFLVFYGWFRLRNERLRRERMRKQ